MMRTMLVTLMMISVVLTETHYYMSAPWTPFNPDRSINLDTIPDQAKFHKEQGVTHAWVIGGMGQWYALTVEERQQLGQAWVKAGNEKDLFVIVHTGASVIRDAVELTKHATKIGANAIAVIPPFTGARPGSVSELIEVLKMIVGDSKLPLYYYHIPGTTGINFKMSQILDEAYTSLPTLKGVKYVDSDVIDFVKCSEMFKGKYEMFWAPEPKLQAMPFGSKHYVLAESYYAPYLSKVVQQWDNENLKGAREAQQQLNDLQSLIGSSGSGASKYVGKKESMF
eukprot:TRINITY_DN2325_c0_g1_i4.p1 TRINITY_DN2325_c0_g1~~TRINITY_DN2325_c0_g1_i4.p1  ORF type:complete len:282 (-),score=62.81 TRINITY_DN2325_c0_g1_i4:157-1002(-)